MNRALGVLVFLIMLTSGCGPQAASGSSSPVVASEYYASSDTEEQSTEAHALAQERLAFEIEKVTERYERKLRQLNEQHEKEREKLKDKIGALEETVVAQKAEIEKLTKEHAAEVALLLEKHQREVQDLESRIFTFQMVALLTGVPLVAGSLVLLILKLRSKKDSKETINTDTRRWDRPPAAAGWK